MCGRYTLSKRENILQRFRIVALESQIEPRYNIAPTQKVPVIVPAQNAQGRELVEMTWGLIPSWVKDRSKHKPLINARAETLAEKPSFKQALIKRRCIIPADSFYEWKTTAGSKVPINIHLKNKELFAIAGLWEQWTSEDGEVLRTCTIITLSPNMVLADIHNRMPAILRRDSEDSWLDSNLKDTATLLKMLEPYSDEEIEYYPVSTLVNSAKVDLPECAQALN
jgi:putative SOS response-associated peptidase YedK